MTGAIGLAATVCLLRWSQTRARLGARVRGLAGVRLRTTARAAQLLGRDAGARALVGSLAGALLAGTTGAAAGALAGALSDPLMRRRAVAARARALEEHVPEAMQSIAAAMRAGRSLSQAVGVAAEEAPEPMRALLQNASRRIELGAAPDDALEAAGARAGDAFGELVETIRVARAAGSDLPAVLDVAVEALSERARLARDRRAATSQARLSALFIAGMPAAFFVVLGPSAKRQLEVLFGDPIGWGLLAGGTLLEAAGFAWMRALTRGGS